MSPVGRVMPVDVQLLGCALGTVRAKVLNMLLCAVAGVFCHAGGMRQLHWHLNFDEWQFVISVSVRGCRDSHLCVCSKTGPLVHVASRCGSAN